jgi:hypothetical protein
MLRIPSTPVAAVLLLAGIFTSPAQAADPHWFYDRNNYNGNGNGGFDRYEDNRYRNGRYDERRYAPAPDYSVYQPDHDDDVRNGYHHRGDDSRFSCLQGVQSLKKSGFHYIEVVDCSRGSYVYEAVRKREPWRIQVSRASGEILAVEPFGK